MARAVDGDRELRRQARRGQVRKRRLVAFAVLVILALGGAAAAALALHYHRTAATTTTVAPPHQFKILFPEGFTRAQMAARVTAVAKIADTEGYGRVRLKSHPYLAASLPRTIAGFGTKKLQMEGFLFPDTYYFEPKSTSRFLVDLQLKTFQSQWRKVDLSYARSKNLTPYDVLKIASMIQAEVAVQSEDKLVAAVIYNRLHLHMPLQIDAATRYGLHIPPTQSLTTEELNSSSPYNLRNKPGMPPTPIDNPGIAAIQAAAHPAHVDYLYYVRKPDHRHHYFTSSYQDFLNHQAEYGY
jgi:UPF0755 protein